MRRFLLPVALLAIGALLTFASFAASTVYVDGVGTDTDCYATLAEATAAVDNGGTVVLTANITTRTASGGETLAAKDVTITSDGTAVLSLGRVLNLGGDTTFENIKIANKASSGLDIIYCNGHDLTIGDGVTTTKHASTSRYLFIMAGSGSSVLTLSNTITIKSGTWFAIQAGCNQANSSGTVTINHFGGTYSASSNPGIRLGGATAKNTTNVAVTCNVYDGTVPNILLGNSPAASYTVNLYGGTVSKISVPVNVDLTNGGAVTIADENGQTVTTTTRQGYTVDHTDTVYSVPFVYLDGTGATAYAKTDVANAFEALPNGGTIFLAGDTTVGTASKGVTTAATAGKVTMTGVTGNEKLTIARSFTLSGDFEMDNLVLRSTATSLGLIYGGGHHFTVGENVTCTRSSNSVLWLGLIAGVGSGVAETPLNTDLVVKSGHFRVIYGGCYQGTFNGTSSVTVSNVTVDGTLSYGSYTGTTNATGAVTLDLRGGKTVSAGTYKEEPLFLVDEGYEAVLNGETYSEQAIGVVAPTTVYLDGTGETEGACTTFEAALTTLSSEGGTIILTGDTQLGTTAEGVVMETHNNFSGKVTITSENGARLLFARSLRLSTEVEFTGIHIHSIIPTSLSAVNNISCQGNALTIGADVTVTKEAGSYIYPAIIGGYTGTTAYNMHIVVNGGTWQNIWGGNYSGTFTGNSLVEASGATVIGTLTAGSRSGSFTGTPSLVLDLRGGKTVSAGTFDPEGLTTLVDTGYEAVLVDGTYREELPTAGVSVEVTGADAFIDKEGKGNVRVVTAATVPSYKSVTGYGTYFIPYAVFMGDSGALERAVRVSTDGALYGGESFSADLIGIPAEFNGETVLAISFCIVGGEEVTTAQYVFSANELIG